MSLFARNALEVMLQTLRIAERQRDGYSFIGSRGFDIGELPILDLKAYPGDSDVDAIDQMMVHCSGVTQGFGVQRYGQTGTAYARKLIISGELAKIAPLLWDQMDHAGMFLNLDEAVHFLALMLRYRNTPYHVIAALAGYLVRNRKLKQRSHHGNGTRVSGGNKGIGIAFDASPSSTLTDFHITTFRACVRLGHLAWLEEQTEEQPRLRVVSHAQAKYPGRANDPGYELWHRVVRPEVTELQAEGHDIVIDTSWTWGTGRVPKWMIAA